VKPGERGATRAVDWGAVRERLAAAQAATERDLTPEQARALLDERARHLAAPVGRGDDRGPLVEIVTFSLGPESFAIEAALVRDVVRLTSLTPVPGTPDFVLGVVNHRGEILMVVDLRKLLGLERPGITDLSRIVVLGEERAEFGLLVDSTRELRSIGRAEILAPPGGRGPIDPCFLVGVTREALAVLDGWALLQDPRLLVGPGGGKQPDAGAGT
jgi:purine-binding chemotaxis protein CheW